MKIDKNKLGIGIVGIFLTIATIASIKLMKMPTVDVKGDKITIEDYLGENQDIITDKTEAENDKTIDNKEDKDKNNKKEMISAISTSTEVKDTEKKKDNSEKKTNSTTVNKSSSNTSDYVVKGGDTLFLIAQRTKVSVNDLKAINNLNSDIIYAGQILKTNGKVSSNNIALAKPVPSRGEKDRDEDLYWLSRIIHSEAQGESYQGKVAVGNVVLNRVSSSQFPNSIKGVVFDKQNGYTQFSPVIDGTIYNTPNSDSIRAAKEVLAGARPVGGALYFLNPQKSTNFWITSNRKYMTTIGKHDFYY